MYSILDFCKDFNDCDCTANPRSVSLIHFLRVSAFDLYRREKQAKAFGGILHDFIVRV